MSDSPYTERIWELVWAAQVVRELSLLDKMAEDITAEERAAACREATRIADLVTGKAKQG